MQLGRPAERVVIVVGPRIDDEVDGVSPFHRDVLDMRVLPVVRHDPAAQYAVPTRAGNCLDAIALGIAVFGYTVDRHAAGGRGRPAADHRL